MQDHGHKYILAGSIKNVLYSPPQSRDFASMQENHTPMQRTTHRNFSQSYMQGLQ